jgi:hypothetical protein
MTTDLPERGHYEAPPPPWFGFLVRPGPRLAWAGPAGHALPLPPVEWVGAKAAKPTAARAAPAASQAAIETPIAAGAVAPLASEAAPPRVSSVRDAALVALGLVIFLCSASVAVYSLAQGSKQPTRAQTVVTAPERGAGLGGEGGAPIASGVATADVTPEPEATPGSEAPELARAPMQDRTVEDRRIDPTPAVRETPTPRREVRRTPTPTPRPAPAAALVVTVGEGMLGGAIEYMCPLENKRYTLTSSKQSLPVRDFECTVYARCPEGRPKEVRLPMKGAVACGGCMDGVTVPECR